MLLPEGGREWRESRSGGRGEAPSSMNTISILNQEERLKRIEEIDSKLADMRARYKSSSPAYQKFLKSLADLLLEEKKGLER